MAKTKVVGFLVTILFVGLVAGKEAKASEGVFELKNRVGDSARCWAGSVLMSDLNYKIIMSCRDISYPGGTEVFSYVVWANPIDDNNAVKLGTLGLGKVELSTNKAFSSLYVTKELNKNVRSPSGPVVMQGGLQKTFLEDSSQVVTETDLIETEPSATPESAAKKTGLNIFRLGGIAAFIALFVIILMILLITRR